MTTPIKIAELISKTLPLSEVSERPDIVVLRASLSDANLRFAWLALRATHPEFLEAVTITEVESDAELADDYVPESSERFRLTIRKVAEPGELRLFFPQSLSALEAACITVSVVRVASMTGTETFTTYFNRFQAWTVDAAPTFAPSEVLPDPRKYCTDLTGMSIVSADIRPWLLVTPPDQCGPVFEMWASIASRKLLAAIADQVSWLGIMPIYHFIGPPKRTFSLDDTQATQLFPRLTEGAAWVYSESRDTEARHVLLANEWARSFRPEALDDLGADALESARSAYSAYVKSGSRETLKALAELRKAVVDESQKISQRAHDLAGAMWKDLAVAVVPFVVKLLPDPEKLPQGNALIGWLAIGAATFLIFSFGVQVTINRWYFKNQTDARDVWRKALNTALSQTEIDQFSEAPIAQSVLHYKRIRSAVALIYFVLVVTLLSFAVHNFRTAVQPNKAALPTVTIPVQARQVPPALVSPSQSRCAAATDPPQIPCAK